MINFKILILCVIYSSADSLVILTFYNFSRAAVFFTKVVEMNY